MTFCIAKFTNVDLTGVVPLNLVVRFNVLLKLAVDLRNDIQRVALRISRGQIKSFSGPVELRRPHSRVNPISEKTWETRYRARVQRFVVSA